MVNNDIGWGTCMMVNCPYGADKEYKPLIYKSSGPFLELKSEHLMTRYLLNNRGHQILRLAGLQLVRRLKIGLTLAVDYDLKV